MENAVKDFMELWSFVDVVEIDEVFTEEMLDNYIENEIENIYMKYNLYGEEKDKVIENVFKQRMNNNNLYLDSGSFRSLLVKIWS